MTAPPGTPGGEGRRDKLGGDRRRDESGRDRYGRDGQAWGREGPEPYRPDRPDPRRLWRNPNDRVLTGLCAGIADYVGIDPWIVRIGTVLAMIPFFPQVVAAYVIASILVRSRPPGLYRSREEEVFWRSVTADAPSMLASLRARFRDLEGRLIGIERTVTSSDFELQRRFRDIDPETRDRTKTS